MPPGTRPGQRAMTRTFTEDWFDIYIPIWQQHLAPAMRARSQVSILEVGSHEGRSACWLMENICTRPGDCLTCLDQFSGDYEKLFDQNTAPFRARLTKIKALSNVGLRPLPLDHFDAIYIDASHLVHDVLRDTMLCWDLLKVGGILIFDDYPFVGKTDPRDQPKAAIDAFLETFEDHYKLLYKQWQVVVERVR